MRGSHQRGQLGYWPSVGAGLDLEVPWVQPSAPVVRKHSGFDHHFCCADEAILPRESGSHLSHLPVCLKAALLQHHHQVSYLDIRQWLVPLFEGLQ